MENQDNRAANKLKGFKDFYTYDVLRFQVKGTFNPKKYKDSYFVENFHHDVTRIADIFGPPNEISHYEYHRGLDWKYGTISWYIEFADNVKMAISTNHIDPFWLEHYLAKKFILPRDEDEDYRDDYRDISYRVYFRYKGATDPSIQNKELGEIAKDIQERIDRIVFKNKQKTR
jgi:hypothetical protein